MVAVDSSIAEVGHPIALCWTVGRRPRDAGTGVVVEDVVGLCIAPLAIEIVTVLEVSTPLVASDVDLGAGTQGYRGTMWYISAVLMIVIIIVVFI